MYQLLWHYYLRIFNTVCLNFSCDSHKKRVTMHLNSINQLVFVIKGHYIFCKIGTKFLNIFQINFNTVSGDNDSLKNNMWDVAINIEIIFKKVFVNRFTQLIFMFAPCSYSNKAIFIIPTDAHNYKITGMLKQLKLRQLLRHVSVHVINDEHNRTIILVLAKHEIAPWWWFLREPKHVWAIVGILIVLTFL